MEGQEFEVTMQAGPMGMNLSNTRVISSVAADGQAAGGGVQVNDVLCAVAGESVLALSYDDVLRRIREGTRPLRLTFVRPAPAQAAPPPPTAFASLFNPKLPNAASMTQGVKAAGSFMKGLLGASVQVIAGMDKIIGGAVVGAVDASTRQASQITAQALHSTRHLSIAEMASSVRGLSAPGKEAGTALALTEADEGSTALRAFAAASEAQLDAIRAGNDNIIRLTEEVDSQLASARRTAAGASDSAARLSAAFAGHLPAIARDCAALARSSYTLREDLIALESRLFSLLLARAQKQQGEWAARERAAAVGYAEGKEELLGQARGDGAVAAQLLAYEEAAAAAAAAAAAGGTGASEAAALQLAAEAKGAGAGAAGRGAPPPRSAAAAAGGSLLPPDSAATGVASMAAAINANLKAALAAGASVGGMGVSSFLGLGAASGALLSKYTPGRRRAVVGEGEVGQQQQQQQQQQVGGEEVAAAAAAAAAPAEAAAKEGGAATGAGRVGAAAGRAWDGMVAGLSGWGGSKASSASSSSSSSSSASAGSEASTPAAAPASASVVSSSAAVATTAAVATAAVATAAAATAAAAAVATVAPAASASLSPAAFLPPQTSSPDSSVSVKDMTQKLSATPSSPGRPSVPSPAAAEAMAAAAAAGAAAPTSSSASPATAAAAGPEQPVKKVGGRVAALASKFAAAEKAKKAKLLEAASGGGGGGGEEAASPSPVATPAAAADATDSASAE